MKSQFKILGLNSVGYALIPVLEVEKVEVMLEGYFEVIVMCSGSQLVERTHIMVVVIVTINLSKPSRDQHVTC